MIASTSMTVATARAGWPRPLLVAIRALGKLRNGADFAKGVLIGTLVVLVLWCFGG